MENKNMVRILCLSLGMFFSDATSAMVTNLVDLTPLTIALGESVDFSTFVDTVQVGGKSAKVSVNFSDTSQLAEGRHALVYTAMTFDGLTQVLETTLDVSTTNAWVDAPIFSGLEDTLFSRGRLLNLRAVAYAEAASGKRLAYGVSVEYPEHLAPGIHAVYYTAIDENGKSAVEKISLTVDPVTDEIRRLEWARLGKHLYAKYFEPTRYTPYIDDPDTAFKIFSYSPTESSITADLTFREVYYDALSFYAFPVKIEPMTARMLLLLKELQHHRYLWIDQDKIMIGIAQRGFLVRSGQPNRRKDRGIYSLRIPVDIFKKETFDYDVGVALRRLAELPVDLYARSDGKGNISHKLYTDPDSGIEVLFMVDLEAGYVAAYLSEHSAGTVTFEENFDYDQFQNKYDQEIIRLNNGEFGRFNNPKLPFIEQQNANQ